MVRKGILEKDGQGEMKSLRYLWVMSRVMSDTLSWCFSVKSGLDPVF